MRRFQRLLFLGWPRRLAVGFVVGFCLGVRSFGAAPAAVSHESDLPILTSGDQIRQLSDIERTRAHRIRIEYLVYYYDPQWQLSWGHSGTNTIFLSFAPPSCPISQGQRVLLEGLLRPADGMKLEDLKVTVLSTPVQLPAAPIRGRIGESELFNERLVSVEGYVDRQVAKDSHHLDLTVVTEGREVLVRVQLRDDAAVPQYRGTFVHAKGVYYSRPENDRGNSRIEIWAQDLADVEISGSLDRLWDFEQAAIPIAELDASSVGKSVRLVGELRLLDDGRALAIADGGAEVRLKTPQTAPVGAGERIEAIGEVAREGSHWVLQRALLREAQGTVTTLGQLWALPDAEQRKWHRLKLEFVVYYYDPEWKALWGGGTDREDYLPLGDVRLPLKAGQRVLIEGYVTIRNGLLIDRPKVTVLAEAVPLAIEDTRGAIADQLRFNKKNVLVEGFVDRQVVTDAHHLELDLIVEGRTVIARVLTTDADKRPDLEGAVLRIRGVYSATKNASGSPPTIELWTSGLDRLTNLRSLQEDPRFKRPQIAIEKLGTLPVGSQVRIVGAVRSQQPGQALTVRDESGQVVVRTAQNRLVQHGELVQAVGRVAVENGERVLHEGLYARTELAPAALAAGRSALRLAGQLRELRSEQAARAYPVKLSGVVTWARPEADFLFMSDASGGVQVLLPPGAEEKCWIGTKIEVVGVSAPGKFAPVVLASTVTVNSTVEMPEARPVTLEQALTGIEEAQWVSMTGFVRAVETSGPWTQLALTTSAGEFHALMPPDDRWMGLTGAVVRLRGVCSAVANDKRQLTDIELWVASPQYLDVEEAAPADPFAVEQRSIASLRQFSSLEGWNRRVRVEGVVVQRTPGRLLHLQEGNEGLMVLSRSPTPVKPGDRIEVVGFPGRENSRVVLRESVYRRLADGVQPRPVAIDNIGALDPELDGRLVRVEAILLDIGTQEDGVRLLAQQGGRIFSALLETAESQLRDQWQPRSRVALTGVYKLQFDEYRRPTSVALQLRSRDDVAVLQLPPWWTARRALGATALLAMMVMVGIGWVVALGRRVRQQTGVIRDQIEAEKAARLEAAEARASKLESLGVFAGGIAHDFNNLLTVVIGNLSLAKLDLAGESAVLHCVSESERAAMRAKDLTQQLLTFAKGGEPIRAATDLPEIVKQAAQLALGGTKVRCTFEFSAGLWPADIDRGQISQAVNQLVTNAVQAMSAGGAITIGLVNEELAEARPHLTAGRYVKAIFTDTGSGISAEHMPRIFDPYFTTKKKGHGLGLATVHSIARKHHGHIEVRSAIGLGTTFTLWLPAAARRAEVPQPAAAAPDAEVRGRVLLMDDEEAIRTMAAIVLRRRGHDVVAVPEGESVVREYQAAKAAGRPFDLVILDLTVPGGMGGAEAMAQLRVIDPAVRAIVASGYSSDPVMANYRDHGFRGRVPKPYEVVDLLRAIDLVLRGE